MKISIGFVDVRTAIGDKLLRMMQLAQRVPPCRISLASRCFVAVVLETLGLIEQQLLVAESELDKAIIVVDVRPTDHRLSLLNVSGHVVTVNCNQVNRMTLKLMQSMVSYRRVTHGNVVCTRLIKPTHDGFSIFSSLRLCVPVTEIRRSSSFFRPRNTSQESTSSGVRSHSAVKLFSLVRFIGRAFALQTSAETNEYLVHFITF